MGGKGRNDLVSVIDFFLEIRSVRLCNHSLVTREIYLLRFIAIAIKDLLFLFSFFLSGTFFVQFITGIFSISKIA